MSSNIIAKCLIKKSDTINREQSNLYENSNLLQPKDTLVVFFGALLKYTFDKQSGYTAHSSSKYSATFTWIMSDWGP